VSKKCHTWRSHTIVEDSGEGATVPTDLVTPREDPEWAHSRRMIWGIQPSGGQSDFSVQVRPTLGHRVGITLADF
jgi:hypothetical protein